MSRWFRHYAGLCRDEKLVSVAIKAKQPIERVVWVWCAILESAAEVDDGGQYVFDAAEAAYFLRADEADILAISEALAVSGRLASGVVVKWGNRQFKSDRSAERVAHYRERKRADDTRSDVTEPSRNDGVTLQKRHCNAPETETETELETDTDKKDTSLRSVERVTAPPTPKASTKGRGSRIDPNWTPSDADRQAARSEGMPEAEIDRTAAKFRDFWSAKAGAAGVKLDWPATWRNWVRSDCERRGWAPVATAALSEPEARASPGLVYITPVDDLDAWEAWRASRNGKSLPQDQRGGWMVKSKYPPNYHDQKGATQ